MRKAWLVAGTVVAGSLLLSGCEGLRDAFSAQADVVATAEGRELSTDRMVTMMNTVRTGRVTPEGAEYMAGLWVDLSLFSNAYVRGTLTGDSAEVTRVMWPQVNQAQLNTWHDRMAASWPEATDAGADSVYDEGTNRLFQHVLVLPAGIDPKDTVDARRKAEGMLAQIRAGRDFATFTAQNNDATKDDSGFLTVGPRGMWVPAFELIAWGLEPGQISDVVETQFGFHIIRRTPKDEAHGRFLEFYRNRITAVEDSTYLASLSERHGLEVQAGLPQAVKDIVDDREKFRGSSKKLISFSDGGFTAGDFVRWLEAFPPNAAYQIIAQPDSVLESVVTSLAQNDLVLAQADSAGVWLDPAEWQALQLSHRATIDQLAAALELNGSMFTDTTIPVEARLDSASTNVERLMDRLVTGEVQFRPLPTALSSLLRESGARYRVNRAGLTRVLELYSAAFTADSAAAAAATQGPIQPAPGPAPVPGGQPPTP
jgi:hypothetical protein